MAINNTKEGQIVICDNQVIQVMVKEGICTNAACPMSRELPRREVEVEGVTAKNCLALREEFLRASKKTAIEWSKLVEESKKSISTQREFVDWCG